MSTELAVRSERVVFPDGIRPASIHVRDGRIVAVRDYSERPAGVPELDAGDLVVLPGLVDTHVHINDPGRTEWEGFEHATRAAAAGGVTTLVDMPLNSIPPTTTVEGLEAKRRAAAGRCASTSGSGAASCPATPLSSSRSPRPACSASSASFARPGVDEFRHVADRPPARRCRSSRRLGLPLLVHAELAGVRRPRSSGDPRSYATWLASRPPRAEVAAIGLLIAWRASTASGAHRAPRVGRRADGDCARPAQRVCRSPSRRARTTSPLPPKRSRTARPPFKCAPPIRAARSSRAALERAGSAGDIDLDRAPITRRPPPSPEAPRPGDFIARGAASRRSSSGSPPCGRRRRGARRPLEAVARWLSAAPARLAGLARTQGCLAPGHDADLVIWDPDAAATIDAAASTIVIRSRPMTAFGSAEPYGRPSCAARSCSTTASVFRWRGGGRVGGRRQESGDRRQETGDRRQETGDRKQETAQ